MIFLGGCPFRHPSSVSQTTESRVNGGEFETNAIPIRYRQTGAIAKDVNIKGWSLTSLSRCDSPGTTEFEFSRRYIKLNIRTIVITCTMNGSQPMDQEETETVVIGKLGKMEKNEGTETTTPIKTTPFPILFYKSVFDETLICMRIFALFSLLLAILCFIYSSYPYERVSLVEGAFQNRNIPDTVFGSWWVGIPVAFYAIWALSIGYCRPSVGERMRKKQANPDYYYNAYPNRTSPSDCVSISLVFISIVALISVFVSIAGSSIDSQGSFALPFIEACVSSDGTTFTGVSSLVNQSAACFNRLNNGEDDKCYCTGLETCTRMTITNKGSCEYIVTDYAYDVR